MWTPIKLCPVCADRVDPAPGAGPDGPFVCPTGHRTDHATSPQERFLASTTDEALYGGAAGGGKSEALIAGALRYCTHPRYRGLVLRRTFPELERHLMVRAAELYPQVGGIPTKSGKVWRFPNDKGEPMRGGVIELASIEHPGDVSRYQSAELQYVAFDELSTFERSQYIYLFSRMRSPAGIRAVMRAGSNPGGIGAEWILERFEPWLRARDEDYDGPTAAPGERLYFRFDSAKQDHVLCDRYWHDPRCAAGWIKPGTCRPGAPCPAHRPQSRTFFPATLADNPYLAGTDYEAKLDLLDPLTRKQLKEGDWLAKAVSGTYFRRAWFTRLEAVPANVVARVRFWDRAATEERDDNDPDYTAGVRMSLLPSGMLVIEDVIRGQWGPGDVDAEMFAAAANDPPGTEQCFEQEPGASGKSEAFHTVQRLAGYIAMAIRPTGDKRTRMKPLSAQAFARNCAYVVAPGSRWQGVFFGELEACPTGRWDQIDAASGAFSRLAPMMPARKDRPRPPPRQPMQDPETGTGTGGSVPLRLPALPAGGRRRGHRGGGW